MATRVVTVNDVLDGHVGLGLECFDRIYLNGWVPSLQVGGQVVSFLTRHLGFRSRHRRCGRGLVCGFGGRWVSSPPRRRSRWSALPRVSARSR